MRTAGVREARQNLTDLLDDVKKGREIVITDRGRPVARLAPVERRRPFPDLSRVRRAREQRLTRAAAQRLHREASKLHAASHRAELTPPIHRRAEQLMLTLAMPLRALDALHLAAALDAKAATVVTFDPRLRDAASSQGLFVAPNT